jgi:hypothetical protein
MTNQLAAVCLSEWKEASSMPTDANTRRIGALTDSLSNGSGEANHLTPIEAKRLLAGNAKTERIKGVNEGPGQSAGLRTRNASKQGRIRRIDRAQNRNLPSQVD